MRITNLPTVSFDDICEHFGWSFDDVSFTHMVENGCYVGINLDEDAIKERQEELEYMQAFEELDAFEMGYKHRLENEIQLIRYFNELGYNEEILVWICW